MENDPIVIVGAARTPMAAFQGDFASLAASDLGAVAIKAAVERAGIAPADVDKTIFGCVLPAGQGQAPARQASLKAGLPLATGATTVNKMCGSAMEAMILAHDALVAGSSDIIVAGGMESMSQAPYLPAEGARRLLPDGSPAGGRPHVRHRRPRGRVRQGAADGDVRRESAPTSTRSRARRRTNSRRRRSHARSPPTTTARSRGKSRR